MENEMYINTLKSLGSTIGSQSIQIAQLQATVEQYRKNEEENKNGDVKVQG